METIKVQTRWGARDMTQKEYVSFRVSKGYFHIANSYNSFEEKMEITKRLEVEAIEEFNALKSALEKVQHWG